MSSSSLPVRASLRSRIRLAVFALASLTAQHAFAESGVTNTVNGVTNNYSSGYTLGTNGAFNVLIVTNAGKANVTGGFSIVGNSAVSSNNTVLVSGPGSIWSNAFFVFIGNTGSFNQLIVNNGGKVFDSTGGSIGDSSGANNNSVTVTGAGSVWTNNSGSTLLVGNFGSGNNVTIANGGAVFNGAASSSVIGSNSTANNNWVTVTGSGSVWNNNNSSVIVGMSGSGNTLTIANSGAVSGIAGTIGNYSGANNNSVIVTDAGSVWSNTASVTVGKYGSGNYLAITNGGKVVNVNNDGSIGYGSSANSNALIVTGPGSVWNNISGSLYVGNSGSGNTLTIATSGSVVDGAYGYIGYNSGANNNSVTVTGSGSVWSNNSGVIVGSSGSGNTLTITNGGMVTSYGGSVGDGSSANVVTVTGAGSVWSNRSDMTVGNGGSGNTLTITNGGMIISYGGYIGYGGGGKSNVVTVTGTGSVWKIGLDGLWMGYYGANNSLIITNGATVFSFGGYLGYYGGANSNSIIVTGAGSVWSNSSTLYVGDSGSGNCLLVANGGTVFSAGANIGIAGPSNRVFVTGPGSVWNDSSYLYVSCSNNLTVANGGTVFSANGYIGANTGANSNSVLVTGANSLWSNSSSLYVGYTGSTNNLTLTNGGMAYSAYGYIGYGTGAKSNSVLVTGAGSLWSNSSGLFVGNGGSSNSLTIANGGTVYDAMGYIGSNAGANGNAVMVTGLGSLWSNSSSLYVGLTGCFSQLTVANGGTVSATNIVVGASASSTGDVVTVSGGMLYATNSTGGGAINVLYGTLNLNSGTVAVDRLLLTNFANSVFNFNGGVLQAGQVFSAQPLTVNGGTLSLAGSFVNSPGGTFQLNSGSVIVPGSMWNQGSFAQNGGLFDPLVFTNSGSFILNSGTNMDGVFLNLASGTVQQNDGEHDVNVATNYGSWAISGGVANLTNLVIDGGGVFTNAGGMLVSTNASGTGGVDVRNGTLALLSGTVTVNQFYATNFANSVVTFNGGTLNSGGTMVNNGAAFTVGDTGSGATLNLVGGTHSFSNSLTVGNSGVGNSLLITNGAQAFANGNCYVGNAASASNNSVIVAGSGSMRVSSNLSVGYQGSYNNLAITNGGTVYDFMGSVGLGNNNQAIVTGAGSLWSNADAVQIGGAGSSNNLTIANGGHVYSQFNSGPGSGIFSGVGGLNSGSFNSLLVTDFGSVWSNIGPACVGLSGTGNNLSIANGGQVFIGTHTFVGSLDVGGLPMGAYVGFSNSVLVTGPGSVLTVADLISVGINGFGNAVTITNSGLIISGGASIGAGFTFLGHTTGANSNVTVVAGSGSTWTNNGTLIVGDNGAGNSLTIASGGRVFSMDAAVGNHVGSDSNSVFVTGTGSVWQSSGQLSVGVSGTNNSLTIDNGGAVIASNFVLGIGGIMTFNGGTLNSGGSTVNNGSIFQVGNGTSAATFDLLGGSHSFANDLLINTNALLTGTGAITGSITDAGLIAPGNGFGVITDTGNLTLLGNGVVTMELGGTNAWLYDQFDLTGALTFDGTLTVALLNGYTPHAGDQFNLFDFGSSSGAFSATNLPTLSPTLYWNTTLLYSTGVIEADQTTGSLQVTLAPQAAIDAGAKWQVDADGNWHTNNETVGGLLVGSHALSYTNLTGWIAPTNQTVQIVSGVTTTNTGTYQLTPLLLAAVSRKTQGAGTFDLNLNLNGTPSATVEPRVSGPTQLVFTFNKAMAAADGTLDATEFTVTNATFVSASISSSNLTLNLTSVVDQSKVTVVMNGLTDLAGNPLSGTNAVIVRSLYGDVNQSGTVNAVDLQQVKNNLLTTLTPSNFLCDVNSSGTINAVDLQQIKNNLLHSASLADSGAAQTLSSSDAGDSLTTSALATTTLGQALGATNLTWSTDGDAPWTATLAEDGSSAAMSGSIGNLNVSWVETTVTGPGILSFQWKVSSELNGDYLTFAIDGVSQPGAISGEAGWQTLTFIIPSGQHRLTWTYVKNAANAAGLDTGWVRSVVFE